ncbi:hypothetical protein DBT_1021 [Dissulfuribacter thermophilus]|uniref:Uncharacterized protein n=1 Tax=Dissulfuribacter thermophilus TaxID=1156395 RepID=A0A1B9F6Z8_9BACT|nr:hypothetical protein DBT_1021 [Dissulfuribacter thermophilus]
MGDGTSTPWPFTPDFSKSTKFIGNIDSSKEIEHGSKDF